MLDLFRWAVILNGTVSGFWLLLNIHPDVWFTNGGFKDKYSRSIVDFLADGAIAEVVVEEPNELREEHPA